MKPIAASTAPSTASKTIIKIGDLGGFGGTSDMAAAYHALGERGSEWCL